MKEAVGTSMVFSLIMVFVAVLIVILVGSISYSKGFKIRNRIIDRIEEYKGFDEAAHAEIEKDLKAIGYKIVDNLNCEEYKEKYEVVDDNAEVLTKNYSDYNYCVYRYNTSRGEYYGVTVFIQFDIPLIGDHIKIPIYGETRIIYDKEQVIN